MVTFDPAKRRRNLAKHGIDLAECEAVFDAPMATYEDTRAHFGEQRWVSFGLLNGRVVVTVWTDRDVGAHVISCRFATRHEEKIYFENYPQP